MWLGSWKETEVLSLLPASGKTVAISMIDGLALKWGGWAASYGVAKIKMDGSGWQD